MKKILYTLLFLLSILSVHASAETIKVEGEDYAEAICTPTIKEGLKEFSNSAFVHNFDIMEKDKTYSLTYKVNAEKKGGYKLTAVTTHLQKTWTIDYKVIVNGKDIIDAAVNANKIKGISSTEPTALNSKV